MIMVSTIYTWMIIISAQYVEIPVSTESALFTKHRISACILSIKHASATVFAIKVWSFLGLPFYGTVKSASFYTFSSYIDIEPFQLHSRVQLYRKHLTLIISINISGYSIYCA